MTLQVTTLSIYPVKALRGLDCSSASIRFWGAEGDRCWVITQPDGTFITQRTVPALARVQAHPTATGLVLTCEGSAPCTVTCPASDTPVKTVRVWKDLINARDAGDLAADWLTLHTQTACRLMYMHNPDQARIRTIEQNPVPVSFADGYPLLIATEASLADLNARLKQPVPMTRFRPNIVIAGAEPWAEDCWRRLRIGTAILRISKPCARCIVTTTDQEYGDIPDKKEPLRTLAKFHRTAEGIMFAQNAIVEQEGHMTVGDIADVLEEGPSNLLP